MSILSYVVTRDFGFAPNPFYGVCTLATCMPTVRKMAKKNDWVIGVGAKPQGDEDKLIYAMQVNEKISFNEYWLDERFRCKQPKVISGSLKQSYGDNIYSLDANGKWHQENSHHSNEDGSTNCKNLKRDTSTDAVLISNSFYYFGRECVDIPDEFKNKLCPKYRGHFNIQDASFVNTFLNWLTRSFSQGYYSDPKKFDSFKRYKG